MRTHPFLLLWLSATLCGCTTIYKSTAGDYANAARQVSRAVLDSETAVVAAQRQRKIAIAATDASCMPKETLYLRPRALSARDIPADYFTTAAQSAGGSTIAACAAIVRCEATACTSACYSDEETDCIAALDHRYALASAAPDTAVRAGTVAKDWRSTLSRLDVIGGGGGSAYLTASYLDILGRYIDILGTAADRQPHAFVDDVKDLNGRIVGIAGTVKSLTGEDIVSAAALGEGEVRLTAFAKLFQDLKTMQSIAADNRAIRDEVNRSNGQAKQATEALHVMVVGNIQAVGGANVLNTIDRRNELRADFARADSNASRRQSLEAWASLPSDDVPRLRASADLLFAKALQAQDTLVQLINNPTDQQLQQIRSQQFASFKNAAIDLADLLTVFK